MPWPPLLDLFCGEGGATRGYQEAGFCVTGVDLVWRSRYCGDRFVKADAFEVLADPVFLSRFVAVHASPPCQSESQLRHLTGRDYPDLLTPTLQALGRAAVPWVVENVESTGKMPGSIVLCGTQFGLRSGDLWLRRHRRFAANFPLTGGAADCVCGGLPVGGVYGRGGGGPMGNGYKFGPQQAREAMGIGWMTNAGIAQAIPPAYTRFVGAQLMDHITGGVP